MNSYTIILVNDKIEQLRRDAAERHATPSQGSAVQRISAALGALAAAITTPAGASGGSPTPALDGYPYRG
jgi:hypothetical protein